MQKFNKIKQVLAVVVIAAASYLAVVIAVKYHRLKAPTDILSDLPKNIDLSLQKVHYTSTKEGTMQWDLHASKVDYYNKSGVIRFSKPEMVLFGKGNAGTYALKGDTADYHKDSGDVQLVGNVSANNKSGMTFFTDHLEYSAARALIATDDRVRLEDAFLSVEGTGMELNLNTRKVRVLRNVTAVVNTRK
ncbi:MAG TPA: LPS export ABC transporter periplasmic protein LptC [Geobacteraceae bacterium]|nr:LPS export ABC transporter periplasmic protein LptC [Geobacteraceae bacterium]